MEKINKEVLIRLSFQTFDLWHRKVGKILLVADGMFLLPTLPKYLQVSLMINLV